jgi:hypothetical protein
VISNIILISTFEPEMTGKWRIAAKPVHPDPKIKKNKFVLFRNLRRLIFFWSKKGTSK